MKKKLMDMYKSGVIDTVGLLKAVERGWVTIAEVVEFITGLVVNIWLGLGVWDYSNMPFNLLGQICLPFAFAWVALSAIAIVLDDYLRYWIFGEEKPRYKLI